MTGLKGRVLFNCGVIALSFSFAYPSAGQRPGGVRSECSDHRGTFCFTNVGLTIEQRDVNHPHIRTLRVYAVRSEDQAVFLSYPKRCETLYANEGRLTGFSSYKLFEDRAYIEIVYSLRTDGRCPLTVLAPSSLEDPSLLGLSLVLGVTRVCHDRPCIGPTLMAALPDKITDWWFSL